MTFFPKKEEFDKYRSKLKQINLIDSSPHSYNIYTPEKGEFLGFMHMAIWGMYNIQSIRYCAGRCFMHTLAHNCIQLPLLMHLNGQWYKAAAGPGNVLLFTLYGRMHKILK